jgi:uncharacterized membrane protein
MYANSLNVVLGIALVYAAILRPSLIAARPELLFVAAGGILVLAWLARRTDHHPWQNNVNMLLGVLLAATAALQLSHFPLAAFWMQFSVGTAVAVLAFWAALYRPGRAAS